MTHRVDVDCRMLHVRLIEQSGHGWDVLLLLSLYDAHRRRRVRNAFALANVPYSGRAPTVRYCCMTEMLPAEAW